VPRDRGESTHAKRELRGQCALTAGIEWVPRDRGGSTRARGTCKTNAPRAAGLRVTDRGARALPGVTKCPASRDAADLVTSCVTKCPASRDAADLVTSCVTKCPASRDAADLVTSCVTKCPASLSRRSTRSGPMLQRGRHARVALPGSARVGPHPRMSSCRCSPRSTRPDRAARFRAGRFAFARSPVSLPVQSMRPDHAIRSRPSSSKLADSTPHAQSPAHPPGLAAEAGSTRADS
jgi:hypothetical protein